LEYQNWQVFSREWIWEMSIWTRDVCEEISWWKHTICVPICWWFNIHRQQSYHVWKL
jgi:hypothetical protein